MNERRVRRDRRLPHLRNRYLLLLDTLVLPLAAWLAFSIRFESATWPEGVAAVFAVFTALVLPLKLVIMWRLGLYSRLWRYASIGDMQFLLTALFGAALASVAIGLGVVPFVDVVFERVPLSVIALDALLTAVLIALPRLVVRVQVGRGRAPAGAGQARRVLIAGAGAAGSMIVRELVDNPQLGLVPVGFLDDDPSKRRRRLHGVEIVGTLADLEETARRLGVHEVIIAMPSVAGSTVREIVRSVAACGLPTRTVPGLFELLTGRKSVSALRKVEIEDLLRRDPVVTDLVRVRELASSRTVLVTGAGGSIGSELCRQIVQLDPQQIVAVGRGENSIFELIQELRQTSPGARIMPVIADVRDEGRMRQVFEATRPSTVFHAAAHKHVPLMEENVAEAILNNVLGTLVVARNAWDFGAERFVLISSDKAVRPSSVMGATKRIAEGVVQRYANTPGRHFVSVRFGNVLGSRGSVIPTFIRQIQAGGPVTVTHRDMRRYFMTIPEAVQLVLQAGVLAEDGEVFVLDMGAPVKIYDLACDVIRLSGLEVGVDIEVAETGIRPGEKLYEELFFDAEHSLPTAHPKVLRARNAALAVAGNASIDGLIALARRNAPAHELRAAIRAIVPEYTGGPTPAAVTTAPTAPASAPAARTWRAPATPAESTEVAGVGESALAPSIG